MRLRWRARWISAGMRVVERFSDVFVAWIVVACLVGLVQVPEGSVARTTLGLAVVLVVPGYLLVALLYPLPNEMQRLYRFALTIPASVAVISLIGLGLSRTSWGLTLTSFIAGLGIFAAISGLLVIGHRLYRQRFNDPVASGSFSGVAQLLRGGWIRPLPLLGVAVSAVVAGALITWLLAPVPSQPLTEFYILDTSGGTAAFPRFVKSQEAVKVTLVIINREGRPLRYEVEASYAGTPLRTLTPGVLQDGEQWRWPAEVLIPQELPDPDIAHKLEFVLYREESRTPVGTVHLWLSAEEG